MAIYLEGIRASLFVEERDFNSSSDVSFVTLYVTYHIAMYAFVKKYIYPLNNSLEICLPSLFV